MKIIKNAVLFITFNTIYDQARYVIFSVGIVNVEDTGENCLDLFHFITASIHERQTAIDTLIAVSVHTCAIDVRLDDQLLLLGTCVENDNERRVVAARRVGEDEDEAQLKKLIERSWKK